MKASGLLLVCLAVYTATGIPLNENVGQDDYPRFIEIEGVDGTKHNVDLDASPNMELVEEIARNPTNNAYSLFTRENPNEGQLLIFNVASSIEASNFNAERPTVVIVHGFLVNQLITMSSSLSDAFLQTADVNVIILDWRMVALQDYVTATAATPSVGRGLGSFLAWLHATTGAPYANIHLVGFSLGAHLVGSAGRELGGRIGRITGLDPAGPLWNFNPQRLDKDDAVYVEVIHTDGGVSGMGIGSALGDVDFFPNGGTSQPGCLTSYCEHNRAWQLFESTVKHNHLIGNLCANVAQITLNTCRGARLHLGNSIINKTGSGMYRVNTGRFYPF